MENKENPGDKELSKTYDGPVKIDINRYRAREGEKISLKKFSTACDTAVDKESVKMSAFPKALDELSLLQAKLYAQSTYGLIIVLQAMDAAGKDGTIRHVFHTWIPMGCMWFLSSSPLRKKKIMIICGGLIRPSPDGEI